eukprot:4376593-Pyramimonas_sp.AAC.1
MHDALPALLVDDLRQLTPRPIPTPSLIAVAIGSSAFGSSLMPAGAPAEDPSPPEASGGTLYAAAKLRPRGMLPWRSSWVAPSSPRQRQ